MAYRYNYPVKGNYIDGQYKTCADPNGEWTSRSPADFADELGKFQYSYCAIDESVMAARKAFMPWRRKKISERAEFLRKFKVAIQKRADEFTEIIAREVGRPAWEAKEELLALEVKIDVTLEEGMRLVEKLEIPQVIEGVLGASRRKPIGVTAVIGPYDFPAAQPCGHIVPALLAGNTVIFKPSEKAPLIGQLIADCFNEAELPPGVFNLLQGEKETGRRLCAHEGIDAILFTGSYEVGTRIKQDTLQQHWKLVLLQMGGKNPAIIWEDADLELALKDALVGGFISAGQRCTSMSRIIIHHSHAEAFVERLHERAKAFVIGHPLDNPFMGPLIDAGSVDRYMKFQGIAVREGCEPVMRGKTLELGKQGNYVAPSICLVKATSLEATKKSVYQQTEIFGPNIAIIPVRTLEEAIAQANATQYGLAAAVYTKSRTIYEKCWEELQAGLINWNRPTITASARLPYGGLKKSGNHFATAVFSTLNSTYPVASLEDAERSVSSESFPGLNWK